MGNTWIVGIFVCIAVFTVVGLTCYVGQQPGMLGVTREVDMLEQAMLSEEQANKEASSKAEIEEQAENEKNILKATKICESLGLRVTDVEYDSSLKNNRNGGSRGTGVIIHTDNFVFHLCQSYALGLCEELALVPIKIKHPGKDEWTDAFGRDFVPFCSCSRGFEEYYLVLGEHRSKDKNYKNIGKIGLKFPPKETITIGEFPNTTIVRTQSEGCNNDLRCIDKETYTGTIVDVELIPWSCPGPTPLDKLTFEDGHILMASGMHKFEYKIGSKHIVEVIIDYTGRRAVKEVKNLS